MSKGTVLLMITMFLLLLSCQLESPQSSQSATSKVEKKTNKPPIPNTLTEREKKEGWQLLFDGKSLEYWKGYNLDGKLPTSWNVRDGIIIGRGKDNIITKETYQNFELRLDFNLSEAANSGIFYFAKELPEKAIYQSAPEYQLVDNQTYLDKQGADIMHKHLTGDAFNLYDGIINPAIRHGKWYQALIRHKDGHVEHWLNEKLCIEYDWDSEDWKEKVANTAFDPTIFGTTNNGHIGLQGWGNDIQFRNIKIRRL